MAHRNRVHRKQCLPASLTYHLEFIPQVLPSEPVVSQDIREDKEKQVDLSKVDLVDLASMWSEANRQSLRIARKFGNGKYFKEMQGEIFWDLSTGKRY